MTKNNFATFEDEDNDALTELLTLLHSVSIHGSAEHKKLELRTNELIDKFGGADKILDQLDKQRKYIK